MEDGFKGNASFFKYARDLGNRRGVMYEIGLWEDSIVESGNDIMYAINIPQESVTIPETMDAIQRTITEGLDVFAQIFCTDRIPWTSRKMCRTMLLPPSSPVGLKRR